MDPDRFRAALGGFLTGVTVVCTRDREGRPAGLTVSSLASVSLDPPLVLFCLDKGASVYDAFADATSFAASILRADQAAVADRFAFTEDPFEGVTTIAGETGAPVLAERLGVIECDVERVVDGGDHRIFLGRVRAVDWDADAAPLAYFRGRYGMLAPSQD